MSLNLRKKLSNLKERMIDFYGDHEEEIFKMMEVTTYVLYGLGIGIAIGQHLEDRRTNKLIKFHQEQHTPLVIQDNKGVDYYKITKLTTFNE